MSMGTILAIAFDNYSSDAKGHVNGEKRADFATGKVYRFIQVAQSLTNSQLAANEVVVQKSATIYEGTNDVSTGLNTSYVMVLGRANATVPQSTASVTYYCWVQITGLGTLKQTVGSFTAGEMIIPHATNDGEANLLAGSATNTADGILAGVMGRAAAASDDTAHTVSCWLNVKDI